MISNLLVTTAKHTAAAAKHQHAHAQRNNQRAAHLSTATLSYCKRSHPLWQHSILYHIL